MPPPMTRHAPDPERSTPAPAGPDADIRVAPCGDAWVMVDWGDRAQANVAARALAARLREAPQAFCAEAVVATSASASAGLHRQPASLSSRGGEGRGEEASPSASEALLVDRV